MWFGKASELYRRKKDVLLFTWATASKIQVKLFFLERESKLPELFGSALCERGFSGEQHGSRNRLLKLVSSGERSASRVALRCTTLDWFATRLGFCIFGFANLFGG